MTISAPRADAGDGMSPAEYDTMARVEDSYWWYRGLRRRLVDAVRAQAAPRRHRILDIGCGTGANARALAASFPGSVVVGVDIAARALAHARRRAAGPLARASANALPFRDRAFDVVLLADVLNVEAVDDERAVREAHRVLGGGGVLVANVPAFEWLRGSHDRAVRTARRYRRADVERLLARAGFVVDRAIYWNALLLPAAWLVRRARAAATSDLVPLPGALNATLTAVLALEERLARRVPVPFGTSVLVLATKLE